MLQLLPYQKRYYLPERDSSSSDRRGKKEMDVRCRKLHISLFPRPIFPTKYFYLLTMLSRQIPSLFFRFFLCHPFVYVHRWKSLVVVCILRDFAPSPRIFLCRRLYYFLLCSRLQFTPLCADFRPPHTHNSGRPFCEAPPFAASSNPQNAFSAPFYCLSLLFSDSGACLIETKAVIRKEFKTKTTLCLF